MTPSESIKTVGEKNTKRPKRSNPHFFSLHLNYVPKHTVCVIHCRRDFTYSDGEFPSCVGLFSQSSWRNSTLGNVSPSRPAPPTQNTTACGRAPSFFSPKYVNICQIRSRQRGFSLRRKMRLPFAVELREGERNALKTSEGDCAYRYKVGFSSAREYTGSPPRQLIVELQFSHCNNRGTCSCALRKPVRRGALRVDILWGSNMYP